MTSSCSQQPSLYYQQHLLAGAFAASLLSALPATIGHVNTTSTAEIYDYFEARKSNKLVEQCLCVCVRACVRACVDPVLIARGLTW